MVAAYVAFVSCDQIVFPVSDGWKQLDKWVDVKGVMGQKCPEKSQFWHSEGEALREGKFSPTGQCWDTLAGLRPGGSSSYWGKDFNLMKFWKRFHGNAAKPLKAMVPPEEKRLPSSFEEFDHRSRLVLLCLTKTGRWGVSGLFGQISTFFCRSWCIAKTLCSEIPRHWNLEPTAPWSQIPVLSQSQLIVPQFQVWRQFSKKLA